MSAQARPARLSLLRRFLRGERFIDIPLRVAILVLAATALLPEYFESGETGYIGLVVVALVTLLGSAFAPVPFGGAALLGYVVFAIAYGEFLNPFLTSVVASLVVLLTEFRWRMFWVFSALLFIANLVAGSVSAVASGLENAFALFFIWLLGAVFGVSAGAFERLIRKEISQREQLARDNERQLDQLRLRVALDTHDTVSHGLAAEAAIMRMLAADPQPTADRDSRLTELALVNAHTQQQLRLLLARLTADSDATRAPVDIQLDLQRAAELIRAATEAGGCNLQISIDQLPTAVPPALQDTALFVLKELATNIVKHASCPQDCRIEVTADATGTELLLRSVNPVGHAVAKIPRSLNARVRGAGGTCSVENREGSYIVTVVLPTRSVPAAALGSGTPEPAAGDE